MFLLPALLFAAASVPSADAIRQQAVRCGVKSDQLVWSVEAQGHWRADISPSGNSDALSFKAVACLIDWAAKSGAHVGFISEPPLPPPSLQNPLPFILKELAPGVYAAIDGPEHKAGSNAGFVIGDDGVLVVDALFTPEAARALVAEIRRITPKPIRFLVNTHYHADHTGGDQVLRDAGAVIIAHKNVRGWIRVNNIALFGDRITPELKVRIEALPLPDVVTNSDLVVWLGSRKVVIRTLFGHTGGDLIVFLPDAKVVFTGDMLWRKVPPNLIDGSVEQWVHDVHNIAYLSEPAHTTYVPGHGDVADAKDVLEFRDYLLELKQLVEEGRRKGLKGDALVQSVAPKMRSQHPDWTISDRAIAAEVKYMDQELAGTKKRPVPVADQAVTSR